MSLVIDLFAGPGGWDHAARKLGIHPVGIEHDADACRTRATAGLQTIRADVANIALNIDHLDGLIASPPCPAFSAAGKGEGRDEIPAMIESLDNDIDVYDVFTMPAQLSLSPAIWADRYGPRWIALEQVPPILPVWEATARYLERRGYRTWTGVLNAADYGVPQTRQRAILIARLDGPAIPPAATHAEHPEPTLFGDEPAPWVSMGEALGIDGDLNTGRDWKPGGTRDDAQKIPSTEPAPALTAKSSGQWHLGFPRLDDRGDSPHDYRERDFRPTDEPAQVITEKARSMRWFDTRPATTIAGDPRVWPPGHKINQNDIDRLGRDEAERRYGDRAGTEAIRLTIEQAAVLQSFPANYPFHGSKTSQFRQCGNAVPPGLAYPILEAATANPTA